MRANSCQSCLMPLDKDPLGGGTEKDGSKSTKYCSYCYKDGEFIYNGDLEGFEKLSYEGMRKNGMNPIKAWFFTKMIRFAPRWKK